MAKKPWDGRFSQKTDKQVETFTSSIDVDKRLYAVDIEGSIAHCKTLAAASVITKTESSKLIEGLRKIKKEMDSGLFQFTEAHEDIHMYIEDRLFQIIGDVAHKLHTGRSRNDQVVLDVRMYLREEITAILQLLFNLRQTLVDLADTYIDVMMPGYTHLQRAQPILFSHYLMAYFEMFSRDSRRFAECRNRTNVMPLGSAALAGTTYPINREYTATLLGFPDVSKNSIDAVADRDFIIEFHACAGICMMHLSRISEELIVWSSSEFEYIAMSDSFATGSSIMPQKKNPDVPELVRGKTGRVFGDLVAILTTMKSLPLAYNRDMQEDKKPLFETIDTLKMCLDIYVRMLPKIKIHKQRMMQETSRGYLNATDFADYLTSKGKPFREAHSIAGRVVKYALAKQKEITELSMDELKSFSPLIHTDVVSFLTPHAMINRRRSLGGTSTRRVKDAIKKGKNSLSKERMKPRTKHR